MGPGETWKQYGQSSGSEDVFTDLVIDSLVLLVRPDVPNPNDGKFGFVEEICCDNMTTRTKLEQFRSDVALLRVLTDAARVPFSRSRLCKHPTYCLGNQMHDATRLKAKLVRGNSRGSSIVKSTQSRWTTTRSSLLPSSRHSFTNHICTHLRTEHAPVRHTRRFHHGAGLLKVKRQGRAMFVGEWACSSPCTS
eukprot:17949-Prorocentrum_minimum.AAC.1